MTIRLRNTLVAPSPITDLYEVRVFLVSPNGAPTLISTGASLSTTIPIISAVGILSGADLQYTTTAIPENDEIAPAGSYYQVTETHGDALVGYYRLIPLTGYADNTIVIVNTVIDAAPAVADSGVWVPAIQQNAVLQTASPVNGRFYMINGIVTARMDATLTSVGAVGAILITLPRPIIGTLSTAKTLGIGRMPGVGLVIWRPVAGDPTNIEMRTTAEGAQTTALAIGNIITADLSYFG